MNTVPLPASALDEASFGLAGVAAAIASEWGGPPTLAEFLELIGWAIPATDEATDGTFAQPLRFKVVVTGDKPYRSEAASRVSDLDDAPFEDARDVHLALLERMRAAGGAPVTPQQFASAILRILQSGRITLADVAPEDLRRLSADVPKKRIAKPKPGDVLAIPAESGGFHMAVVLTRNGFGTALGLFQGTSAQGRLDTKLRLTPRKDPVYTEDSLVMDGTWKVVGHDASLLTLFPSDPPIYHRPNAAPGIDTGPFGAAETGDRRLRLIGPDEAREVGLLDGTYRPPVHHAAWLQRLLDDRAKS